VEALGATRRPFGRGRLLTESLLLFFGRRRGEPALLPHGACAGLSHRFPVISVDTIVNYGHVEAGFLHADVHPRNYVDLWIGLRPSRAAFENSRLDVNHTLQGNIRPDVRAANGGARLRRIFCSRGDCSGR